MKQHHLSYFCSALVLSLFALGLMSCDSDSEPIVEKPELVFFQMNANGELEVSNDGGYLYFHINKSSSRILKSTFFLNGHKVYSGEGWVRIDNNNLGVHKLRVEAEVRAEKSVRHSLHATYDLRILAAAKDLKSSIVQSVTKEGYLQISWDNPQNPGIASYYITAAYDNYYNEKYKLQFFKEITDPSETSFVDEGYIYGERMYRIRSEMKNPEYPVVVDMYYKVKYEPITRELFTLSKIDENTVEVKWTNPNPYLARHVLANFDSNTSGIPIITVDAGVNSFTVNERYLYGFSYYVYVLPRWAEYADYKQYQSARYSMFFYPNEIEK